MAQQGSGARPSPGETPPASGRLVGPPASPPPSRLLREAVILQLKLILEGIKDVLLGPIALVAVAIDLLAHRPGRRLLFYETLRQGERFERFLNLYGALPRAPRASVAAGERTRTLDTVLRWGERRVRTYMRERQPASDRGKLSAADRPPPRPEPPAGSA